MLTKFITLINCLTGSSIQYKINKFKPSQNYRINLQYSNSENQALKVLEEEVDGLENNKKEQEQKLEGKVKFLAIKFTKLISIVALNV